MYSVHTLRHTCATLMYRNGTDIKTIKELLGHVQIDTTEIYTHLHNKKELNNNFNTQNIQSVELNLLNGQVEI